MTYLSRRSTVRRVTINLKRYKSNSVDSEEIGPDDLTNYPTVTSLLQRNTTEFNSAAQSNNLSKLSTQTSTRRSSTRRKLNLNRRNTSIGLTAKSNESRLKSFKGSLKHNLTEKDKQEPSPPENRGSAGSLTFQKRSSLSSLNDDQEWNQDSGKSSRNNSRDNKPNKLLEIPSISVNDSEAAIIRIYEKK